MNALAEFVSWVGVALITLLPILNPMATVPLLLAITPNHTEEERNQQVRAACMYVAAILLAFLIGGHLILLTFGISLPGIRIAGGAVVGVLGFRMLFPDQPRISGEGQVEATRKPNISFSPLAMPGIAGPGSIAVVITMSSSISAQRGIHRLSAFLAVVLAILISALVSWVVLRSAGRLQRILGVNGVDSLSRIMGFLLACIGVQFVINGVKALIHGGL